MRFFLRMHAWQISTLLIAGLFILPMMSMILSPGAGGLGVLSVCATVPAVIFLLGWLHAAGMHSRGFIPAHLQSDTGLFRWALRVSVFYSVTGLPIMLVNSGDPQAVTGMMSFLLPMHLLTMICNLYALIFVSRNLAMAELRRKVAFHDYVGPFFLIWFLPVGVFWVQPRLQCLGEGS